MKIKKKMNTFTWDPAIEGIETGITVGQALTYFHQSCEKSSCKAKFPYNFPVARSVRKDDGATKDICLTCVAEHKKSENRQSIIYPLNRFGGHAPMPQKKQPFLKMQNSGQQEDRLKQYSEFTNCLSESKLLVFIQARKDYFSGKFI
jgi:hypothetical protein